MEEAKESKPVAMITEGTRIDVEKDNSTEQTVYNTAKKIVNDSRGLVIADFNFKDVDRFKTFYKIAVESNRKLVISFKHACFLERYASDKKLDVPDSDDENIMLFKPKLGTGTYDDDDYSNYKFIKNRLNYPNILTADEIRRKQDEYILVLNFWYFNNLVDLKPENSVYYIHSLSEPFNEEMEISFERMKNWLDHFNLKSYRAHCSGHASRFELRKIIEGINPEKLYPIHTEHPEMFRDIVPGDIGVDIPLKDGVYEIK